MVKKSTNKQVLEFILDSLEDMESSVGAQAFSNMQFKELIGIANGYMTELHNRIAGRVSTDSTLMQAFSGKPDHEVIFGLVCCLITILRFSIQYEEGPKPTSKKKGQKNAGK